MEPVKTSLYGGIQYCLGKNRKGSSALKNLKEILEEKKFCIEDGRRITLKEWDYKDDKMVLNICQDPEEDKELVFSYDFIKENVEKGEIEIPLPVIGFLWAEGSFIKKYNLIIDNSEEYDVQYNKEDKDIISFGSPTNIRNLSKLYSGIPMDIRIEPGSMKCKFNYKGKTINIYSDNILSLYYKHSKKSMYECSSKLKEICDNFKL
jgi:hypothetical protein